jgi:Domain of unknown function (DUF5668)
MSSSAYIRAIRGPVLLIVLGVLMLADHRGSFSFWQTWPLLLVTAGLLVLAERSAIRENPWAAANGGAAPPPAPPPNTIAYRPFGQPDQDRNSQQEGGPQA